MEHRDNPHSSGKVVRDTEPTSEKNALDEHPFTRLRQQLMRHFDEPELRTLFFDLGEDYDELGGEGKEVKVTKLIAFLDRRGRVADLIKVAVKKRPNVDWEAILKDNREEPPTLQPLPSDPPSVEFVNRAYELDLICKPGAPRFILIDGAAGYGKTYLLRKVKEIYDEDRKGWKTALIDLNADPRISSKDCYLAWPCIADTIIQQLPLSDDDKPTVLEEAINGNVADLENNITEILVPFLAGQGTDILLLFDGIEILQPETNDWLKHLMHDLDLGLQNVQQQLRVAFAGRYVGDWGHGAPYASYTLSLSPFDLGTVRTMVEQVIQTAKGSVDADYLDNLAWWILHTSGGHPRGIRDVLEVIGATGFVFRRLEFVFLRREFKCDGRSGKLFQLCIEPIIDKLLQGIEPQLRAVLAAISPIRRFDQELLDTLLGQTAIVASGHCSSWELVRALLQTHLISPPTAGDPMFSDQIVRRMLAMQMQIRDTDRWRQINERALDIFHNWAIGSRPSDAQVRRTAIIESLYHALQLEPQDAPTDAVQERLVQRLNEYLAGIQNMRDILQLQNALSQDTELNDLINRQAGNQAFPALLNIIDRCLP